MMNSFWWGNKKDGHEGIHWMNWKRLCIPKEERGMGFRMMAEFNDALLAKQGWKLLTDKNSLVYQVFKARYFPQGSFLDSKKGTRPSYLWSSIHGIQNLLAENCRRRIGDGTTIKIWEEKWLPSTPYTIYSTKPDEGGPERVCELFETSNFSWNASLLQEYFNEEEVAVIKYIPLASTRKPDSWVWIPHPRGIYTVKPGYKTGVQHSLEAMGMTSQTDGHKYWRKLWSL